MEQDINWIQVFEDVSYYVEHAARTGSVVGLNVVITSAIIGIILLIVVKNTKIPGLMALITAAVFGTFFLIDVGKLKSQDPYVLVGTLSEKHRISHQAEHTNDMPKVSYHVMLDVEEAFSLTEAGKGKKIPNLKGSQDLLTTRKMYTDLHEKGKVVLICMPHNNRVYGFVTGDGKTIIE